jgi:ABC-2 type transport system permease protein
VIANVARREILLQIRDGRLLMAAGALIVSLLSASFAGWTQYHRAAEERAHFVQEARDQWLNQGERHPHRAAHFGVYVTKPELSLALFEPGLRPFAGQTLWLEAHDRPAFANIPSEDDLSLGTGLGVASGAAILQILGALLALSLGALGAVRERESGVLRQILSQGIKPERWLAGKFAGLAGVIGIPLIVVTLFVVAGSAVSAPAEQRIDVILRAVALMGAHAVLLGACLAIGLAISAVANSSRTALMAALAFWVGAFILAPRAAATLVERFAPAPTLEAYLRAKGNAFNEGFDARGGYAKQLEALESKTLKDYGVEHLAELPTGFSGLRMKHLDSWSTEVDDREYARLLATYAGQAAIRLSVSLVTPFIATRSVSQGMAGMDWPHHRHFLEEAEAYRRGFGEQMNTLLEKGVQGERWEMDGTNADWASVAPFGYDIPKIDWAIRQQLPFVAILLLWGVVSAILLVISARKLRP